MTTEDGSDSARLSATMQKPIHLQHAAYANTLGIQDNEVQTETGEGGYDYKTPPLNPHGPSFTHTIGQRNAKLQNDEALCYVKESDAHGRWTWSTSRAGLVQRKRRPYEIEGGSADVIPTLAPLAHVLDRFFGQEEACASIALRRWRNCTNLVSQGDQTLCMMYVLLARYMPYEA
ncbi:hypothetical protein FPV67DRAFT_1456441 [Lyophyllum atratum]|nr:hypothetical protein FPV67DRAFT_1456441 [Lyophyllum atratum]